MEWKKAVSLTNCGRESDQTLTQPGPLQIVEFVPDAGEISHAIAVAVHKRARIDLLADTAFPPFEVRQSRSLSSSGQVIHLASLR